jgi:preprotein translocase subunit SecY
LFHLFHTSNMPIILHSALITNLYFISQVHASIKWQILISVVYGQFRIVIYSNLGWAILWCWLL